MKDIIELNLNDGNRAFVSTITMNNSIDRLVNQSSTYVFLNNTLAKQLNISENDKLSITKIHTNCTQATAITIEPVSLNDWQILELNLEQVQNNLLNQLKVVYKKQVLPIWIDSHLYIKVRIVSFEPCYDQVEFTAINSLTRVNIQPIISR